ncbi:MAG: AraC family transcriptional regulator [Bacteroidaceae bacterium]|jgi:AraC-like DNA-binding protein|nr:AraC family transcriptional regulator [Bacteroidaceae bacterium]
MAKYNIRPKKEKPANYRMAVSADVINEIYEQLLRKMIVEKKYRDPHYTAARLAEEIGTNTRYISAAVSLRFQQTYSELINGYRVREAVAILTDRRYRGLTMAEIAAMVGYSNRQSFYAAFYRAYAKTPKEFQDNFYAKSLELRRSRKPRN